jgi:hypothetical protein
MKLIGAWVAVILLLVGVSCRSKQKSLLSKEMTAYHQHTSETQTQNRALSVEQFGDTLRGRVPLPYPSPNMPGIMPFRIPVQSSGISLEFTLDSTGISYQAIAKPVAKVQIQESASQTQEVSQSEAVLKEEIKQKEVKQGIPWWLILLGVLLVVAILAWRVFKINFKPF